MAYYLNYVYMAKEQKEKIPYETYLVLYFFTRPYSAGSRYLSQTVFS